MNLNGWLENFRNHFNIRFQSVTGEGASVDNDVVDNWKEKVHTLIEGYDPENVFNMEETGLFFRALPNKSLNVKGSDSVGVKQSKDCITISLCANMKGEFEKPLIIGKAALPLAFRNITTAALPVTWKRNKKAWTTTELFMDLLKAFDKKMLFLDNAPSHPKDPEFTNVKLVLFPANTTSHLQPMDQGIIQNM